MWPGLILIITGILSLFWDPLGRTLLWMSNKVLGDPQYERGILKLLGALGRLLPIIVGGLLFSIGSWLHKGVIEARGKIERK